MSQAMIDKLTAQLEAVHVQLHDFSSEHAGHYGPDMLRAASIGPTHVTITVVSSRFEGLNTLERHRMVHKVLQEEMNTHIHAMQLKTLAPTEWQAASMS